MAIKGIDVSAWQGIIDWGLHRCNPSKFIDFVPCLAPLVNVVVTLNADRFQIVEAKRNVRVEHGVVSEWLLVVHDDSRRDPSGLHAFLAESAYFGEVSFTTDRPLS